MMIKSILEIFKQNSQHGKEQEIVLPVTSLRLNPVGIREK